MKEHTFTVVCSSGWPAWTNARGHWTKGQSVKTKQRRNARISWAFDGRPTPSLPAKVTFTRIAPRRLDDDNLPSAFKYVRDLLAVECWGLTDDSHRAPVAWIYKQEKGSGDPVLRITLEAEEITFSGVQR